MSDELNQQADQSAAAEAGSVTPGESVPSVTATASTEANPDQAPSNPATAELPSDHLTEQTLAPLSGSSVDDSPGELAAGDTARLSTSLSALSADQPNAESAESTSAALPANAAPLLARLHADLEALERKIELGIHVFAHEVAAIRDQVKSLI
ncbi:hypothetical protein [Burkholderia gladioli]|uniref:hypothetical protein n=1 Tax=Burkholderia gladioli TaxID=28095 RepID=UPI001640CAB9|nr:hypothetical protein [Burkholderia gladioli]